MRLCPHVQDFLYPNPVVTCIASAVVLGEKITPVAVTEALCIMAGVWLAAVRIPDSSVIPEHFLPMQGISFFSSACAML